jgi:hypothetical protein
MDLYETWERIQEQGEECRGCAYRSEWQESSEFWGAVKFHFCWECNARKPEQCPGIQWAMAQGELA